VARQALRDFDVLVGEHPNRDELATYIYEPFINDSGLSKATAAQYLARILQSRHRCGRMTPESLRAMLPRYIVDAIEHVTLAPSDETTEGDSTDATAPA